MNVRRDLDELFDIDSPTKKSMNVENLANQLIHSYVFHLLMGESGGLQGIFVASDHLRNDELLSIGIIDIINVFELAAKGEGEVGFSAQYDEKRKDYVVRLAKSKARL